MKKRFVSFFSGMGVAFVLVALCTSALAASGQVTFNFANVALNGETKIAAGSTVTVANGQQVPSSILYTDAIGGKTNYLPIRTISELLGVEIGYDSATRTVLLGDQNEKHDTADKLWNRVIEGDQLLYQCDVSDAEYDALPAWHPMWDEEGWGVASVDASRSGNQWVQWKWQKDNSIIEFICCYPCQFKMGRFMSTDDAFQSRQVTINNCQAELYVDGDTSLLAWENGSGVFFWVVGTRVEAETLMDFANNIRHENDKNSNLLTLPLVPEGYIRTDRTVVGNTVYEVWTKEGQSFTWLCTDNPVAVPSLESRTVSVKGEAARFWDAIESSVETPTLVNGEPIKGNNVEVGDITLSAATIPGVQSNSVSTLVWGDLDNGLQFRIQGAFDSDSLIQMAEQCK